MWHLGMKMRVVAKVSDKRKNVKNAITGEGEGITQLKEGKTRSIVKPFYSRLNLNTDDCILKHTCARACFFFKHYETETDHYYHS